MVRSSDSTSVKALTWVPQSVLKLKLRVLKSFPLRILVLSFMKVPRPVGESYLGKTGTYSWEMSRYLALTKKSENARNISHIEAAKVEQEFILIFLGSGSESWRWFHQRKSQMKGKERKRHGGKWGIGDGGKCEEKGEVEEEVSSCEGGALEFVVYSGKMLCRIISRERK